VNTAEDRSIRLEEIRIDEESYFRISNVDRMRPFFMSIVSDSNHWLFMGSNGGISAGRKNADHALFPYYTDDKIIESAENTGSKSIFRVKIDESIHTWEPYSIRYENKYQINRHLYKSRYGNKIIFEEINHDLGLTYRCHWNSSDIYGFVKKTELINQHSEEVKITLLDGIQNVMPQGVGSALQTQSSNLVDAYKRNELDQASGMGIFALSAVIVDKAEPSEALKANIAWTVGLDNPDYLLSSLQLDNFRSGNGIQPENDIKAERGAYFVHQDIDLAPGSSRQWMIVADVNYSIASVIKRSREISNDDQLSAKIQADIDAGTERLLQLNASADALQLTADNLRNARHYSNTLFNIMRGGIFDHNYQIEKADLITYLRNANRQLVSAHHQVLQQLPDKFTVMDLKDLVKASGDPDLQRLCYEYLPLKFSRRHGDPSRPWNQFTINTHDENDGSKVLDYEGNWRDIFQNWEALAHSYPAFIEGMIFRFLNASTFDGYNPYRITKNGIDWERIEPDDPWSYIGYWGDHQIIYLLKFLEFAESREPGMLQHFADKDIFVYANVPYKIKSYAEQLKNPKDTIDYDHQLDLEISRRRNETGADAANIRTSAGQMHRVNFMEKILAMVLAKISNFIPEGGIWMNTQRPEWNDANNALVGNGVSVVTLAYLVRFMRFFLRLCENLETEEISVSQELHTYFSRVHEVLRTKQHLLAGKIGDEHRKSILDGLGMAGSDYRNQIYRDDFSGQKKMLIRSDILQFTQAAFAFLEHSLKANRREDHLYHAYNLMSVRSESEISISRLSEMLEGQVAALSSGSLSTSETIALLDALRKSALYRKDQSSYLLYPEKELPGFLEKNRIPANLVDRSALLRKMTDAGRTDIVEQDIDGNYHFNGKFRNAKDLNESLNTLDDPEYAKLVSEERQTILDIYEEVFNHKAFTGRSGTFYGYEGLGSIYWHMVSKLLLAVGECCLHAIEQNEEKTLIGKLATHFHEINRGIGVHKSPERYGAFPTDPYSRRREEARSSRE